MLIATRISHFHGYFQSGAKKSGAVLARRTAVRALFVRAARGAGDVSPPRAAGRKKRKFGGETGNMGTNGEGRALESGRLLKFF